MRSQPSKHPAALCVQVLLSDPSMVLDMKAAGLPASLEIDDGIKP